MTQAESTLSLSQCYRHRITHEVLGGHPPVIARHFMPDSTTCSPSLPSLHCLIADCGQFACLCEPARPSRVRISFDLASSRPTSTGADWCRGDLLPIGSSASRSHEKLPPNCANFQFRKKSDGFAREACAASLGVRSRGRGILSRKFTCTHSLI